MRMIKVVANMTKTLARVSLSSCVIRMLILRLRTNISKLLQQKPASCLKRRYELSALVADQPEEVIDSAGLFGLHLGLASFQIQDDLLDYVGSSELIGKNIGDDLLEGKFTLPLIYLKDRNHAKFSK